MVFMSIASFSVPFCTWSHHLNKKLSTTSLNHGDNFKPSSPASAFLNNSFNSSWFTYFMSATSSGLGLTATSRTMKSSSNNCFVLDDNDIKGSINVLKPVFLIDPVLPPDPGSTGSTAGLTGLHISRDNFELMSIAQQSSRSIHRDHRAAEFKVDPRPSFFFASPDSFTKGSRTPLIGHHRAAEGKIRTGRGTRPARDRREGRRRERRRALPSPATQGLREPALQSSGDHLR
ncbi:hypothetical protein LXL04_014974 [Taraxacum kok-saghyz]